MAEHIDGKFAQMFNEAMRQHGVTMKQLAASTEYQYEAFRKLARGLTTPGPHMLQLLHERVGIDIKKAQLAITEDKARRKGMWSVVAKAAGKNPEMDPIDQVWHLLTEQDKHELVSIAQMKAKINRQRIEQRRKSG